MAHRFIPSPPDISELYGVSADACMRCHKNVPGLGENFCKECTAFLDARDAAEVQALDDYEASKVVLTKQAMNTPPEKRSLFQRQLVDEYLGVTYD